MPITLEKLLSPTAETTFEFMGESVTVTYAPMRYTGAMQDLAVRLDDELSIERARIKELREEAVEVVASANGDKKARVVAVAKAVTLNADADRREQRLDLQDRAVVRNALASDGDGKGGPPGMLVGWDVMDGRKPLPVTHEAVSRLPDLFLRLVFLNLARENQPDPQKAPDSVEP